MKIHAFLLLALMLTAGTASARNWGRLDRAFAKVDLDQSGTIDPVEWLRTQNRRASVVDARWRFMQADDNGDQQVSLVEFRASRGGRIGGKPNKLQAFDLADEDGDGFLTPIEFADTLPSTKPWKRILKLFSRKDRDEDSLIDSVEFGIRFGAPRLDPI